jgi:uncharacterized protein
MSGFNNGEFCWVEIGTTDVTKAKSFYQKVFGWKFTDPMKMPDGSEYFMWSVDGIECGGLCKLNEQQAKSGVPAHFLNFMFADKVDDYAKRGKDLGGELLMPAFDVGEHGRMAVLKDPTGAPFALWQSMGKNEKRLPKQGTQGKVGWRELWTNDIERAGKFYCDLFGFDIEVDQKLNYHTFKLGGSMEGGMMQIQRDWGDIPSHWATYINSKNVDQTVASIKGDGGKIIKPADDIPGVGRFAIAADPLGADFGVIQFANH